MIIDISSREHVNDQKADFSENKKSLKGLGIYIHIPFCLSRCNYCDFYSSVKSDTNELDKYVSALCDNIEKAGADISERYVVDTVFIGGGTPSVMRGEHFLRISNAIHKAFNCNILECTSEGNPKTLTEELMLEMKQSGVNRLSIGVQTVNDSILSILGRCSKLADIKKCLELGVNIFDNVSCDVMVGLPFQTEKDVLDCLNFILPYGVEHISCYNLQLEEGTKLFRDVQNGKYSLPTEDEAVRLYDLAYGKLKANDFIRYEVSNFAKVGKESRHNMRYWKCEDYIGFGASASSCLNGIRFSVKGDINDYVSNAKFANYSNFTPSIMFENLEKLTDEDMLAEKIMLGFRTARGIDASELKVLFGIDFFEKFSSVIAKNRNYLLINGDNINIKEEYMYVMNSIISDFMP